MNEVEQPIKMVANMEVHKDTNYVVVSINTKIYPIDVIQLAAYVMIDKAYIILDGDPNQEISVELRGKDQGISAEELGREFNNQLLNYAVYKIQSEKNKEVKDALIKSALEKE